MSWTLPILTHTILTTPALWRSGTFLTHLTDEGSNVPRGTSGEVFLLQWQLILPCDTALGGLLSPSHNSG